MVLKEDQEACAIDTQSEGWKDTYFKCTHVVMHPCAPMPPAPVAAYTAGIYMHCPH